MRTGQIEASLLTLNDDARLPFIPDLVARTVAGPEQSTLKDGDIAFRETQYQRLRAELQTPAGGGTRQTSQSTQVKVENVFGLKKPGPSGL